MLLSMTGFVTKSFELTTAENTIVVTVQIKSLNARFFEASCKMPYALAYLEPAIVKKLRESLARGTVYCNIYLNSTVALSSMPLPAYKTIEGYVQSARAVQEKFGLQGTIDINTLLQLPHTFEFADQPIDAQTEQSILAHIDTMITELIARRAEEGNALERDLAQRIAFVSTATHEIQERATIVQAAKKEQLLADLATLMATTSAETKDHHLQLAYNQLERIDVTEEIVRLRNHVDSAKKILGGTKKENGKQLDFTLQEMFREINTIAAKCSDAQLSNLAISVKVELEKAREQVQNIV